MPSTSPSVMLAAVQEELAAVERGEFTPPVDWLIPMRVYYEESEKEQNELIAQQNEQLELLEKAGMIRTAKSPKNATPAAVVVGDTGHRLSINKAFGGSGGGRATSMMSLLGSKSFRRKSDAFGAGGGRNSLLGRSTSGSPLQFGGGGDIGRTNSGTMTPQQASNFSPLIRRQSSIGFGLLGDGGVNEHRPSLMCPAVAGPSSDSTTTTTTTTPANTADPRGGSAKSSGGVRLATSLVRFDANGQPIRLKPMYNPYRNHAAEDAARRLELRPASQKLLKPLTFEEAAECRDPFLELQRGNHLIKVLDETASHGVKAIKRQVQVSEEKRAVATRMAVWRAHEEDQLYIHHRDAVKALCVARDESDVLNRRNREMHLMMEAVQEKAAALQAEKNADRQRMKDLALESQHRVDRECLIDAEHAFRNRLVSTEAVLRAQLMNTGGFDVTSCSSDPFLSLQ